MKSPTHLTYFTVQPGLDGEGNYNPSGNKPTNPQAAGNFKHRQTNPDEQTHD